MASFSKVKLSASTDGKGVLVAAVATAGTTIHTAHATALDEVWLWAYNTDTTPRKLTIEFGGAATADTIEQTIPAESGAILVIPGWVLTNSMVVRAFAALTNVIAINGYVNRIS
jgi:hypothetical protein